MKATHCGYYRGYTVDIAWDGQGAYCEIWGNGGWEGAKIADITLLAEYLF